MPSQSLGIVPPCQPPPLDLYAEHDVICFLKGDMFIVHNELEDGWMWVTNLRTDEQGLIVEDLVEEVGREEDPHEGKIWFHGKISKQEAYNLLMTVGQVCSFLVRPSDNTPGDYSLYFRTSENIQRFKICPTSSNQFMMGGRYYNRTLKIITNKIAIFSLGGELGNAHALLECGKAFIAEHDVIWYGISLFVQFGSAVLAVSPPNLLPTPSLQAFEEWGWRDSLDAVPALLSSRQK
ncbi:ras GTPase-activating protein 1-like [Grus japonensis]|uniref:Ras GTPase-activating protein 1-like n=1 Tax=Grus japonensis TaxID=30415 RepID=A0ABC9YLR8_GRUJA